MISKEKNLDKTKQKQVKDKVDKILKNTSFFMPNIGNRYKRLNKIEKDDFIRTPVPIKRVRVKSVLGNAEKVNAKIKQFVDPQNNHHIVIYKDENGELKNDITNFWKVVERVKQNDQIYKLPEIEIGKPAPKELVLTFQ